jgi:hypothetical protein
MGLSLPDHIVEEGKMWYPAVHAATVKGSKDIGISSSQGSGIVAAVSPNMDFERNNINALQEITNIDKSGWDMIQRSASQIDPKTGNRAKRIPEISEMLKEVAPSLGAAYDTSLLKARRILNGEQWRDVLSLRTGPKTFRFAGNIEDPFSDTGVTVDGRHHDIVANSMRPWTDFERGISSAGLESGRPTRYEDIEEITRLATNRMSKRDSRFAGIHPHDAQAIFWVGGKFIETQGGARRVGPKREGQQYTTALGGPLRRDAHFWTGRNDS